MFRFGRFWAGSGRRFATKETRRRIRARPRSVGGEADSNAGKYRDACDGHMWVTQVRYSLAPFECAC